MFVTASKYRNSISKKIIAEVHPRIKRSDTVIMKKYCTKSAMRKYYMVKFLPKLTASLIWLRECLVNRGR